MIDAALSFLSFILETVMLSQELADIVIMMGIGFLVASACVGTVTLLGVEWTYKNSRWKVLGLISRLVS